MGVEWFSVEWSRTSLRHSKNLDVLQKAFRNFLALGIMREIGEAEYLAFARKWKLRIEGGPVDLIAQLDAGQHDAVGIQRVKELLKVGAGESGVGIGKRRTAPHGRVRLGLIRPRRGAGRILGAGAELNLDAVRFGALGVVHPLLIVRDAAADDVDLRRFQLAEDGILIGDAGAHRVDHVHAHHRVLRRGPRGREEEVRRDNNSYGPAPLCFVHPVLPDDCEDIKT